MKPLVKILSIHPALSLILVIGYLTFLYWFAYNIWVSFHEVAAIVFVLVIAMAVKSRGPKLIKAVKLINEQKQEKK